MFLKTRCPHCGSVPTLVQRDISNTPSIFTLTIFDIVGWGVAGIFAVGGVTYWPGYFIGFVVAVCLWWRYMKVSAAYYCGSCKLVLPYDLLKD
jgi:hypothetical protein